MRYVNLSAPGATTEILTIKAGENARALVQRTEIGGRSVAGRSAIGKLLLERNNIARKFVYSFQGLAYEADARLLQYFSTLLETNPQQQFLLEDRWELVPEPANTWHTRQIISGTEQIFRGLEFSYISLLVLIFPIDGTPVVESVGGGLFQFAFTAQEI